MPTYAKIIKDSINTAGDRLTTFEVEFPRFILPQFNTHRVFSRNTASSRAIPVAKRIAEVYANPVIPEKWGKNQAGMVANEEFSGQTKIKFYSDLLKKELELTLEELWLYSRDRAVEAARALENSFVHKEVANRLLEPYSFVRVIVTSSTFSNFFHLRISADAQVEIRNLAEKMHAEYLTSTPNTLQDGEWHLPYILEEDYVRPTDDLLKVSAARCARVSYVLHDGKKSSFQQDLDLYKKLTNNKHIHASPMEHQAAADSKKEDEKLSGNLGSGWVQYRKTLPYENCRVYDPTEFDEWYETNG